MTTQTRIKDPTRRTAFATGVLYLITFIGSIPAAILLGAAQFDPTFTLHRHRERRCATLRAPRARQHACLLRHRGGATTKA